MIGYACVNVSMNSLGKFSVLTPNAIVNYSFKDREYALRENGISNMTKVIEILKWNIEHGIYMYRITSTLVNLISHPYNCWDWENDNEFNHLLKMASKLVLEEGVRLSFHLDHYFYLNTIKNSILNQTIQELEYHAKILERLGGGDIIMHIGGVYANKEKAMERFHQQFFLLNENIRNKIRIENDDKTYKVNETLKLCEALQIPMVLDIHHHKCNNDGIPIEDRINKIFNTWKKSTRKPKIHLSSGQRFDTDRYHASFIKEEDYLYARKLIDGKADIMVEAKATNEAVLDLIRLENKITNSSV